MRDLRRQILVQMNSFHEIKRSVGVMNNEKKFMDALKEFSGIESDMAHKLQALEAWRAGLDAILAPMGVADEKVQGEAESRMQALGNQIKSCIQQWSDGLDARALLNEFSDSMADRMVLLVFGKVNAGKSSFCNFIASRFAQAGHTVRYFMLDQGRRVDLEVPFKEGATETTACIQGVELGGRLVMLDTPGLHSVTPENGSLTQRYLDAADAVLWLTSSAAPGQVQELAQLQAELALGKPVQAVITRSDRIEQDEEDGKLVSRLMNKTHQNRNAQEGDVFKRATEYLQQSGVRGEILRTPISVSAHCAKAGVGQEKAMELSGFEQLFGALAVLAGEARAYKRAKPARMLHNFLARQVKADLVSRLLPACEQVQAINLNIAKSLRDQAPDVARTVRLEVMMQLPVLLDRFRAGKDKEGLLKAVAEKVNEVASREVGKVLEQHLKQADALEFSLNGKDVANFTDEIIEVPVRTGAGKKALVRALCGGLGALGGLLLGGVAGIAGAAAGEAVGNWVGGKLEKEKMKTISAGVSYAELHASLQSVLDKDIPQHVQQFMTTAASTFDAAAGQMKASMNALNKHVEQLKEIR
jgi:predicted GTPase